jgi:hypothetical protein
VGGQGGRNKKKGGERREKERPANAAAARKPETDKKRACKNMGPYMSSDKTFFKSAAKSIWGLR